MQNTAGKLGIADYHANCSPEDKLEIIRTAQQNGETVIMVGDGINDAPVLAGADASIAPAHGALLAQTSADIILVGDNLRPLATWYPPGTADDSSGEAKPVLGNRLQCSGIAAGRARLCTALGSCHRNERQLTDCRTQRAAH